MAKVKKSMTREQKQNALARKEPRTKARKDKNRRAQELAATVNRVSSSKPWDKVRAARAAIRHGVSGAA